MRFFALGSLAVAVLCLFFSPVTVLAHHESYCKPMNYYDEDFDARYCELIRQKYRLGPGDCWSCSNIPAGVTCTRYYYYWWYRNRYICAIPPHTPTPTLTPTPTATPTIYTPTPTPTTTPRYVSCTNVKLIAYELATVGDFKRVVDEGKLPRFAAALGLSDRADVSLICRMINECEQFLKDPTNPDDEGRLASILNWLDQCKQAPAPDLGGSIVERMQSMQQSVKSKAEDFKAGIVADQDPLTRRMALKRYTNIAPEHPFEWGNHFDYLIDLVFEDMSTIFDGFFDCWDWGLKGLCYKIKFKWAFPPWEIRISLVREYRFPVQIAEGVKFKGMSGYVWRFNSDGQPMKSLVKVGESLVDGMDEFIYKGNAKSAGIRAKAAIGVVNQFPGQNQPMPKSLGSFYDLSESQRDLAKDVSSIENRAVVNSTESNVEAQYRLARSWVDLFLDPIFRNALLPGCKSGIPLGPSGVYLHPCIGSCHNWKQAGFITLGVPYMSEGGLFPILSVPLSKSVLANVPIVGNKMMSYLFPLACPIYNMWAPSPLNKRLSSPTDLIFPIPGSVIGGVMPGVVKDQMKRECGSGNQQSIAPLLTQEPFTDLRQATEKAAFKALHSVSLLGSNATPLSPFLYRFLDQDDPDAKKLKNDDLVEWTADKTMKERYQDDNGGCRRFRAVDLHYARNFRLDERSKPFADTNQLGQDAVDPGWKVAYMWKRFRCCEFKKCWGKDCKKRIVN